MIRTTLASAAMLCLVGCVKTPDGFVPIETGAQYDQRFLSADGVVIARRSLANPRDGTLEYWTKAVQKELVASAGYRLDSYHPFEVAGRQGVLLDFRTGLNGVEHTYLVAMLVDKLRITLIEAGGESQLIEPCKPKLLEAMRAVY